MTENRVAYWENGNTFRILDMTNQNDRTDFSKYVSKRLEECLKFPTNKKNWDEFQGPLRLAITAIDYKVLTSEELRDTTNQVYHKLKNCYKCFDITKKLGPPIIIEPTLKDAKRYNLVK